MKPNIYDISGTGVSYMFERKGWDAMHTLRAEHGHIEHTPGTDKVYHRMVDGNCRLVRSRFDDFIRDIQDGDLQLRRPADNAGAERGAYDTLVEELAALPDISLPVHEVAVLHIAVTQDMYEGIVFMHSGKHSSEHNEVIVRCDCFDKLESDSFRKLREILRCDSEALLNIANRYETVVFYCV